jgi:hypothetical protein
MIDTADVTSGKPIAVSLQSISSVSALNPLVAFYDIHGGKREVLFFYFVLDTTRGCDCYKIFLFAFLFFMFAHSNRYGCCTIFIHTMMMHNKKSISTLFKKIICR